MQDSVATIQCSNVECQAYSPQDNKFCHKCGTPLLKRYLWALGDGIKSYPVGQLLNERYFLKAEKILLDTKPGLPPRVPDEVPDFIRTYLKLFPYRLHIPQAYSVIPHGEEEQENLDIYLLEYGTIPLDEAGELHHPHLLPELTSVWPEASPLRQLNWLWQMARLWQPLESQKVVSSLLNPLLLRVNGATIQLLELQKDDHQYHSLKELGDLWSSWVDNASPFIADLLQHLCEYLQRGKIPHPEYLLTYLEPAISQCGQWYKFHYQIFTGTDSGPSRDHNEDACYPSPGELKEAHSEDLPFALVCDGIGGQDGGEIASQLAIAALASEIPQLCRSINPWNSQECLQKVVEVIGLANNQISDRNDSEQRQDRRRMGTTLVMSLSHGHEMYIANVGDSRIYRITPNSCHQLTTDDDLACREARLGYLFYRDAIQYAHAGALVQALGMANSSSLHPNVQRLIVDEDCAFLLCSDGLSDYDRVDQYWESEIVPLFQGEIDIASLGERLIKLANEKNGHDNVTIGLVSCQVKFAEDEAQPLCVEEVEAFLTALTLLEPADDDDDLPTTATEDSLPTEPISQVPAQLKKKRLFLFSGVLSLLVVGVVAYSLWQSFSYSQNRDNPSASPTLRESP